MHTQLSPGAGVSTSMSSSVAGLRSGPLSPTSTFGPSASTRVESSVVSTFPEQPDKAIADNISRTDTILYIVVTILQKRPAARSINAAGPDYNSRPADQSIIRTKAEHQPDAQANHQPGAKRRRD